MFTKQSIRFAPGDLPAVVERIERAVREAVRGTLRRRGVVVGLSGGIDSSLVAALAVRALGRDHVLGLYMNEVESSPETVRIAREVGDQLGIATIDEPVSQLLSAAGCYARRDEAIRSVVPRYGAGWRCKIVLPSLVAAERLRVFSVVVRSPDGEMISARMPPEVYLQVVAATNFKQRTRKMLEYYHADRLGYAVAGTPNLLEYDQGFFVKNGDGAADIKPIAHLYKTQVYQLAEWLDLPETVRARPPTTDTYSLPQSQEEFYFSVPYDTLDACLYARDHGVPIAHAAEALGLAPDQVERVYRDIDAKRSAARYLHAAPITLVP
ncbi:MAG TPA: NAD(+) synthase [Kofleriaceae bacterium]|nr:NAD(+) synthase [Kofleriaceae bacterium]